MGTDMVDVKGFDQKLAVDALQGVDNYKEVISELNRFLEITQTAHSSFQIDHFILNATGVTDYGKYKQGLRELTSRYGSLKSSQAERMKKEIEIRRKSLELNKLRDDANELAVKPDKTRDEEYNLSYVRLDIETAEIELNSLMLGLETAERQQSETLREFSQFYDRVQQLEKLCGLKGRTGEDRVRKEKELEEQYWLENFKNKMDNSIETAGNIGPDLLEAIKSLPVELSNRLLQYKKEKQLAMIEQGIDTEIKAKRLFAARVQQLGLTP